MQLLVPKPQTQHENIPYTNVSACCHLSLGSTLTYINMKIVRFYVQTAINLQRKCLGTRDGKIMENMFIDFIWLNLQAKYLIQKKIISLYMRYSSMKVTQMPPVHVANLVANGGNRAYRADVISSIACAKHRCMGDWLILALWSLITSLHPHLPGPNADRVPNSTACVDRHNHLGKFISQEGW